MYVGGSCAAIVGETRLVEKRSGSSTEFEWKWAVFWSVVVGESMEIVGIGVVPEAIGLDDSTGTMGSRVVVSLTVVGGSMSIEGVGKTVWFTTGMVSVKPFKRGSVVPFVRRASVVTIVIVGRSEVVDTEASKLFADGWFEDCIGNWKSCEEIPELQNSVESYVAVSMFNEDWSSVHCLGFVAAVLCCPEI